MIKRVKFASHNFQVNKRKNNIPSEDLKQNNKQKYPGHILVSTYIFYKYLCFSSRFQAWF